MNMNELDKRVLTYDDYLEIQDELNSFIIENWKEELTEDHFKIAIFDEMSELICSTPWKWWKKQEETIDSWNMRIEVIDILHFSLSIFILKNSQISDLFTFGTKNTINYFVVDGLSYQLLSAKLTGLICKPHPMSMQDLIWTAGLTQEEVSAIYVSKATLNYVRQTNGYKSGKYVKIVDGVEDNRRIQRIVEKFLSDETMTLKDVYNMTKNEFFDSID